MYYFSEKVNFTNIYQKKCNLFHELISSPDRISFTIWQFLLEEFLCPCFLNYHLLSTKPYRDIDLLSIHVLELNYT